MAVAALGTGEFDVEEQAPRFLRDRAAPSVRWSRAGQDDGARDHEVLLSSW